MDDHFEAFVSFSIGADRYALPADVVRGIFDLPELTRIEAAPDWVAGSATLFGELVPVLDFDALCGIRGEPWRLDGRIVVLERTGARAALQVSELGPLLELPAGAFARVPATACSAAMIRFVRGQSVLPGTRLTLLDGDALLALADGAAAAPFTLAAATGQPSGGYPALIAGLDADGRDRLARRAARLARIETTAGGAPGCPYLVFRLGGECFVLDARGVQELTRIDAVFPLPCAPADVVGSMNLRGEILVLVDLGRRLGLPRSTVPAVAVVVMAASMERMGLVVESVEDVFGASADDLAAVPVELDPRETGRLAGMIRWRDVRLPLLDLERLVPQHAGCGEPS